jgi:hypothetical protein
MGLYILPELSHYEIYKPDQDADVNAGPAGLKKSIDKDIKHDEA